MRLLRAALLAAILLSPALSNAEDGNTVDLGEIVVTGSREAEPLKETPVTVNAIKKEEIKNVRPTHPSELMNRVPGVWINSTGGEGHITSIRQPLTTNPVYLYLEDGIPVRSTGFFNHNALYEVNMPGADRVEVIKGTGTALYGSDAIGGTINIMTRPAPLKPEFELNPEVGSYDWYRLLASAGNTWGNDGLRLDLNTTHSGGWRERKGYDRYSGTLRWDRVYSGGLTSKTVLDVSKIDQETSGGAPLLKGDYDTRPSYNYQTFDFRNVEAFRLSSAFEKENDDTLISLTPYTRWNKMYLLPEWGIFNAGGNNYKGYISTTEFYSLGFLAKYRKDFAPMKTRLITGVDLDYSPGKYKEDRILVTRDAQSLKFTGYTFDTSNTNNYDFEADFFGISPYVQGEVSPVEKLRFTVGARYDALSYDYTNKLSDSSNRPASTVKSYYHLSPKFGATYSVTDDISVFASYNKGFRIPSVTDLFKASGTATTAIELKPIKVDSYEVGTRGKFARIFTFDTALYYMKKKDDIVTFNASAGNTQRLNAGKTEHKGVEVGLGVEPVEKVALNVSYSYSKHTYLDWKVSSTTDYSGKEISIAPRQNLNVRLDYTPDILKGGVAELEWAHLGSYWLDDANTEKYDGYDLINARVSYKFRHGWEAYAKALNIFDRHYADRASKSSNGDTLYAPGTPISFFAGLVYKWGE